jgi:NTE family protein
MKGQRQGMVMAGGGARAAYGVGVLKALLNGESPSTLFKPIDPMVYAGTSAGAFNAAMMVSRGDSDPVAAVSYLEDVWLKKITRGDATSANRIYRYRLDPTHLLSAEGIKDPAVPAMTMARDAAFLGLDAFRRSVNFVMSPGHLQRRFLELFELTPVFSTDPLDRLIDETVDFGAIRSSERHLRITTTKWRTGEIKTFKNADMTDDQGKLIILASTAVPGIFPAVAIGGEPYVDGGVVMNTPLKPAIDAGADVLHIIYQDPQAEAVPVLGVRNMIDTINRLLIIGLARMMNDDIEYAELINHAITGLEKAERKELKADEAAAALITAGRLKKAHLAKYRKLTIHRYHPHDDLGGIYKMLSFRRSTIGGLIERGFRDALRHDCQASKCITPDVRGTGREA